MQVYSNFFKTLHDEISPTGYLGRGTHYSIIRGFIWHDCLSHVLGKAAFIDIAIIWDEDHDTRIIQVIELLSINNLLSPALIIGERKGTLYILVSEKTIETRGDQWLQHYQSSIEEVIADFEDHWPVVVGTVSNPDKIINDDQLSVTLYLKTINMLWQLGIKEI